MENIGRIMSLNAIFQYRFLCEALKKNHRKITKLIYTTHTAQTHVDAYVLSIHIDNTASNNRKNIHKRRYYDKTKCSTIESFQHI